VPVQNIDAIALKTPQACGRIPDLGSMLPWGSELVDGVYIELEMEIFTFRNTVRLQAIAIHSRHGQFDLGNKVVGLNEQQQEPANGIACVVGFGTSAGEDFHVSFLFQVSNDDARASCSTQILKLLSFSGFTASKPVELLAPSRMLPTASS
jgi:hypothetical protein